MKRWYILAGILSFLVALPFTLPPQKALNWWGNDLQADVRLHNPQGGLASGTAAVISVDGLRLNNASWRMRWLSLFKGRLGFVLRGDIEGQPAEAATEFALGGKVVVHDLLATLTVKSLQPFIRGLLLPVDGHLQADFDSLVFRDQLLSEASGQLQLRNLAMNFMRPPLQLGSYQAEVSTQDDVVTATVSEAEGAPINVEGALTLTAEGRYQLDLRLRARANTEQRLKNQLNLLGRPDAQGWYRLKSQGQL